MASTAGWVMELGMGRVRSAAREAVLIILEIGWGTIVGYGPILLATLAAIGVTVGIVALTFAILEGLL